VSKIGDVSPNCRPVPFEGRVLSSPERAARSISLLDIDGISLAAVLFALTAVNIINAVTHDVRRLPPGNKIPMLKDIKDAFARSHSRPCLQL